MRIRIKALDTLFFRDGKPFERGDESWADGIFPPPPSVFYGALRTLYFSLNSNDFHLANTDKDPTKKLKINDISIQRGDDIYLPPPADFVHDKDDEENFTLLCLHNSEEEITSSILQGYRLKNNSDIEEVEVEEGMLSFSEFEESYLQGLEPNYTLNIQKFFTYEPKVGIARNNNTLSVEEGMLYRVGMLRTAYSDENETVKLEFVIDFSLENFSLAVGYKGILKLGGENKSVEFEVIEDEIFQSFPTLTDDIFKIYIKTPAIFKNESFNQDSNKEKNMVIGWLPKFLNKDYEGEWNGVKVKLIACSIGKPKYFGGFNMVERRPKVLFKAIPEGAVYFFKIIGENKKFTKTQQGFNFSDERSDEGFGISYLANVNSQLPNN